jgi:Rps23 Pro-64 3,4-dihydroxylase Tpa1-like proline 4-hydroxylase
MNIEQKREFFKENGYCDFSIKDVDVDFYNFLETNLICNSEKNLQDKFSQFRFDSNKIQTRFQSSDVLYETARLKKEEFLADCDKGSLSQCWYFYQDIEKHISTEIRKGIDNIIKYFYGYAPLQEKNELQLTYYDDGCVFTPHSDGQTVNLCSVIIYLNKNYDESNGGLLILNNGYVTPEFGQCALMDLSKHDIKHGVTEVTGGPGRYAILAFPKPPENIKD